VAYRKPLIHATWRCSLTHEAVQVQSSIHSSRALNATHLMVFFPMGTFKSTELNSEGQKQGDGRTIDDAQPRDVALRKCFRYSASAGSSPATSNWLPAFPCTVRRLS
jgi:hypothetical protein